jgi:hypothetical protein
MADKVTEDRLICDRFYTARHIPGLPYDLEYDEGRLTIDYARQSEVTSRLRVMLQEASERGDNVGTDEFDGPYGNFFTDYSFVFVARFVALRGDTKDYISH